MHCLALTFKHAVEFSSFVRAPRFSLSTSAWGNPYYFTDPIRRSQIRFLEPAQPTTQSRKLQWVRLGRAPLPVKVEVGAFGLCFLRSFLPQKA